MEVQLADLHKLHDAVMSTWTEVFEACLNDLVESVPQRGLAVLMAKAGPARY